MIQFASHAFSHGDSLSQYRALHLQARQLFQVIHVRISTIIPFIKIHQEQLPVVVFFFFFLITVHNNTM